MFGKCCSSRLSSALDPFPIFEDGMIRYIHQTNTDDELRPRVRMRSLWIAQRLSRKWLKKNTPGPAHNVTVPRGAASEYRICVIIMAGLNARGLQSKLLITPLTQPNIHAIVSVMMRFVIKFIPCTFPNQEVIFLRTGTYQG